MKLYTAVITFLLLYIPFWIPGAHHCERWVAPSPVGNDAWSGSQTEPWATLTHAAETIPDDNCTVWITAGTYNGRTDIDRRFRTMTTFKAVDPYTAVLQNNSIVLKLNGVRNIVFDGLELRHSGPAEDKYLAIADRSGDDWTENVTFRNNIFHDSTNNDILKLHNGVRFVTVTGNVFYNQGPSEQHMDVNSVTDIIIQDNIFFNDFAGSDRENPGNTKHFIVVKDSNENSDGLLGSRRITIRRNIFLNWQSGNETFIQIGNDGKPYYEARDVLVENNLMLGNSPTLALAAFGVRGAKNVTFNHNTVVGDLPAKAYAFRVSLSAENPPNDNIQFHNNIWSDPTGTMGSDGSDSEPDFSDGKPEETLNLVLDNNLYWNGSKPIPSGNLVSPLEDDANRIVGNPGLETDLGSIVLPRWTGTQFLSGNQLIREEFVRLVLQYGRISNSSPAVDQADPAHAATEDILHNPRFTPADLGAFEVHSNLWHAYTPIAKLNDTK